MWSITLRDAMANPLLGIGPLNYVCTSPEWLGHPHNFPLQIAAEWGIPAALMICVIFLIMVYRVTWNVRQDRYNGEEENVFAGLLLTGVIAAALHACLSGVMVMPASQVTGLLVCGMLLGLGPNQQADSSGPEVTRQFFPVFLLSIGLLLSAGLTLFGVNELRTMDSRAATLHIKEALRPRFWQNSKVCELYAV
jgi:O-antigen ligase